jgi:hypothetical protein
MSRITQKPAVGVLNPWATVPSNSNLSSTLTATPIQGAQAYAAIPATGTQPSSGTGFYSPNFVTYVGAKFDTSDGRTLVIVQNGNVAVGVGKLVQAPVEVTAFELLAMTVPTTYPATAGATQILVTNGATVLKLNQFQGGFAIVGAGTGAGQTLKIASHAPAAASAKFVLTLEDPIQTALDATSTITLIASPFGGTFTGVVISNHSALGLPVGITITPLAASTAGTYDATYGTQSVNGVAQYGLVQTSGLIAGLIDNTVTNVGYPLGPSTVTDGALGVATLTSKPQIAVSAQTQTSADYGAVFLQL